MAKQCINCGVQIRFKEDFFSLTNEGKFFCEKCGKSAEPLLNEIKFTSSAKDYKEVKMKFEKELAETSLSEKAKRYMEYEFNDIAQNSSIVPDKQYAHTKWFHGSLQVCRDAIYRAGKKAAASEPIVPIQCMKIFPGRTSDIYVVTASFVCSLVPDTSSACLSITMVWTPGLLCKGTAIVSAVCSESKNGNYTVDWKAEDNCTEWFWKALCEQNPEFEIKPYEGSWSGFDVSFENYEVELESGHANADIDTENRIGVFGGTFDPVHLAHVALGRAAIKEAGLSKLIVMPAYIQPFKQGKRVTEDEHRLAMTKLAFEDVENAEISTFETDRMRVSYTYDTLTELKKSYPDDELFFITGTDAFLSVDTWYKGIDLLQNFSFIVSVRPGYLEEELNAKISEYRKKYNTNVIKLVSTMPDISSSAVRDRFKSGESVTGLIPEKVERYIKEHGLYQRD